jgi:2-oxoglutarate/2-oxoacid ferredoxin oxidoreductase subunit alpha
MAVSDTQDSFDLMPEAFNLAERFQTPVIVMTDKHIAESIFTQLPYDQKKATIDRGALVRDPAALKKLQSVDRYDPNAKDGISQRWLPGSDAATYCAQADEHNADGTVDETPKNAVEQMKKRMKKMAALEREIPEPTLYRARSGERWAISGDDAPSIDLLVVSWGSNKGVILDALRQGQRQGREVGYLQYQYLWPMKTERLKSLMAKAKRTVLVECNHEGQLGKIIQLAGGPRIEEKILKYDGRPFFYDELVEMLRNKKQDTENFPSRNSQRNTA